MPRLLLWGWFVYLLGHYFFDVSYEGWIGGLNLGIHEFGHLICQPFGQFITVAGGSLVQCLIPLISFWMFYRQQDYFAFSFSFVWLGTNLIGVARYIADARKLELDLVSPFGGDGEIIHDWNYLLNKMHLLIYEQEIGFIVRVMGLLAMTAGVAWGAWMLWLMMRSKPKDPWERLNKMGLP